MEEGTIYEINLTLTGDSVTRVIEVVTPPRSRRTWTFYIRAYAAFPLFLLSLLFLARPLLRSLSFSEATEILTITGWIRRTRSPNHRSINPTICPARPRCFDRARFESERSPPPHRLDMKGSQPRSSHNYTKYIDIACHRARSSPPTIFPIKKPASSLPTILPRSRRPQLCVRISVYKREVRPGESVREFIAAARGKLKFLSANPCSLFLSPRVVVPVAFLPRENSDERRRVFGRESEGEPRSFRKRPATPGDEAPDVIKRFTKMATAARQPPRQP